MEDAILCAEIRIAQHRHETLSFETLRHVRRGQSGEFDERRVNVHRLDERVGRVRAGLGHAGCGDDKRQARGLFVVVVLAPPAVVAEVPAVIAPEHDDGVRREAEPVEFVEHLAKLCVHVTHRRVIAVDEHARLIVADQPHFGNVAVLAQLAPRRRRILGCAFRRHSQ